MAEFVALLKQKSYLDIRSGEIIEIEVPIFRKMKTNYPALIFVFLAGVFGYLWYQTEV
jgi:hypothetical protein